jgi:hypothetical protein
LYSNDNEITERLTERRKEREKERKKDFVELPCAGEGLRRVNISEEALEQRRR